MPDTPSGSSVPSDAGKPTGSLSRDRTVGPARDYADQQWQEEEHRGEGGFAGWLPYALIGGLVALAFVVVAVTAGPKGGGGSPDGSTGGVSGTTQTTGGSSDSEDIDTDEEDPSDAPVVGSEAEDVSVASTPVGNLANGG